MVVIVPATAVPPRPGREDLVDVVDVATVVAGGGGRGEGQLEAGEGVVVGAAVAVDTVGLGDAALVGEDLVHAGLDLVGRGAVGRVEGEHALGDAEDGADAAEGRRRVGPHLLARLARQPGHPRLHLAQVLVEGAVEHGPAAPGRLVPRRPVRRERPRLPLQQQARQLQDDAPQREDVGCLRVQLRVGRVHHGQRRRVVTCRAGAARDAERRVLGRCGEGW